MGKLLFKAFWVLSVLFVLGLNIQNTAYAASVPSFPSCSAPSGSIIANYSTGTHGVIGRSGSYSGSDTVYSLDGGNALQCLCGANNQGVQTDWWDVNGLSQGDLVYYQVQGWIYASNGKDWGLQQEPYLASNSNYACNTSGGTPSNNNPSNNNNNGGSNNSNTCSDQTPGGSPTITNATSTVNSITLYWSTAPSPVTSYVLAYGTKSGSYPYGVQNISGSTTSFTVGGLSAGTTYYFILRAGNGCQPGPFSSQFSHATLGGITNLNVLGISTIAATLTPTPTPKHQVLGASLQNFKRLVCTQCIWFPIVAVELILILVLYFYFRKSLTTKTKWLASAALLLVGYLVFLFINRNCIGGIMNFWLFSIPCVYFWVVQILIFALTSSVLPAFLNKDTKK